MRPIIENDLRKLIRTWPEYNAGLITFIEPARGSDVGVSDCLFTHRHALVPVELKLGPSVVKALRPSQRAWHRTQLHAGLPTYGFSLRKQGDALLFRLALSGGLMSDITETLLHRFFPLEDASFNEVVALFQ